VKFETGTFFSPSKAKAVPKARVHRSTASKSRER
jgi:hypothetical protein